jgi:hypothetical protein
LPFDPGITNRKFSFRGFLSNSQAIITSGRIAVSMNIVTLYPSAARKSTEPAVGDIAYWLRRSEILTPLQFPFEIGLL